MFLMRWDYKLVNLDNKNIEFYTLLMIKSSRLVVNRRLFFNKHSKIIINYFFVFKNKIKIYLDSNTLINK